MQRRPSKKGAGKPVRRNKKDEASELIRLNKFIANSGVCSRREADELIADGKIKVNDKVVTEMGFKVGRKDKVTYKGRSLRPERHQYVLLNKPKDYITTAKDPQERKTVMKLVARACKERIYPVGRLDRNTSGLLLFTNDGDLTKKLSHPSFNVRKIYQVRLNKPLAKTDMEKIAAGLELEDGPIKVDAIAYDKKGGQETIGVALHSGRNRIVRRIFEHVGYDVVALDRVVFAGLTKKDLPRGKWRMLSPKEIGMLKMVGGKRK